MLLLILMSVLLACGVICAQEPFTDDFNQPALNPRWEWFVPKAGPTVSLSDSPGHLRLTVPQVKGGFNQWSDAYTAPLLLTKAPQSNFSVETHVRLVSYTPDSNFHIALIVGMSKRYLLGWGPFLAPALGNPTTAPQVWGEPTGLGHFIADTGDARDVYLRIERTGNTYCLSLRRAPEASWQEIGQWHTFWPPQYIGLMGKTFGDGGPVVADIDYMRVEITPDQIPLSAPAVVRVDCEAPARPLNPWRFGHFLEPLGNCIDGGLWAEMLLNRKFTGKTAPEGIVERWQAFNPRSGVTFSPDNERTYCPSQAQRIHITRRGRPSGIAQPRRVLLPGASYQVRLVAAQQGLSAPVIVGFRAGDTIISQVELTDIGSDWTTRHCVLPGPAARTEAEFFIATQGPGTLWLGAVSLMPADNVEGFRADVLAALKQIKPTTIRWPGGNFASGYDWRDGIGEQDRRPPRWNRAWNQWEWNDMGTHEFLRLCELLGATPHLTVNAGEGSTPEAAAWVEYCNGSAQSRWGRLRARNGHPAPWKVPLWSIGNEMWGGWQLGRLSATNYAIKAVEFARAMRAIDPSITLIGVGVDGESWGGWNREVCRILGKQIDLLSVHHYCEVNDYADPVVSYSVVGGDIRWVENVLGQTADLATATAGKPLPVSFDEWNVSHPGWPASLRDGLYACRLFNAFNRLGDKVPAANMALMVNIMGLVNANADGIDCTGTHRAFELYTHHTGNLAVPVQTQSPQVDLPNAPGCPVLDASATLSADRKTLYLAVVNIEPLRSTFAMLSLAGFQPTDTVQVNSLTADSVNAINSQAKPNEIRLNQATIPLDEALHYVFPPHSATVLTFTAR